MPRTLPAALTTVMNTGIYTPYIRVQFGTDKVDDPGELYQPSRYTLNPLTASVTTAEGTSSSMFRIIRGAVINGTPSTISTIFFNIVDQTFDGKFHTYHGEALNDPTPGVVITPDESYQNVIEIALDDNLTFQDVATYEGGTPAWLSYKFYPAGKSIVLPRRKKLFTLLQQKYLIFATENGYDSSTKNQFYFFTPTRAVSADYTIEDPLFNESSGSTIKKLIWRDESNTVHSNGSAVDIHNLGYLESTASAPNNVASRSSDVKTSTAVRLHLKYRTGDYITFTRNGQTIISARMNVREIFNTEKEPSWYMELSAIEWYSNTEGGALPSTIEAAAPYTPLVTGTFDGILDENDNNIQAAMETIDGHTHSGISTEEIQDLIGAMVSDNTETGIAVTYQDSDGTIDFVLDSSIVDHPGDTTDAHDASAISVADAGTIYTGTDVEAALQELAGGKEYAFNPWLGTQPYGTTATLSHLLSVSRTITFEQFLVALFVNTTNDGSNYWTITVKRITTDTTICEVNTSGMSAGAWSLQTTTSFSVGSIGTANIGAYIQLDKTGAPGTLYVGNPKFVARS